MARREGGKLWCLCVKCLGGEKCGCKDVWAGQEECMERKEEGAPVTNLGVTHSGRVTGLPHKSQGILILSSGKAKFIFTVRFHIGRFCRVAITFLSTYSQSLFEYHHEQIIYSQPQFPAAMAKGHQRPHAASLNICYWPTNGRV
jgi:hypothetical protein